MYPISDFAYGMLSIVILYVTVGLIFQAIKKTLTSIKDGLNDCDPFDYNLEHYYFRGWSL
ncbi:Uncharacterised protein [Enterobacter hormaechei]|nr:hypothetical protein SS12_16385 [Enterobacter hormaechei subsp. hoffmannii]CZV65352.1 Uncharacterised protein [Enterobacter hormaechei]SAB06505.1 Uncharacterised protein [Enterobacter hormaechei]SAE51581.1 Uncharacterised protein [Enterobacter hormaechei]SAF75098.1 Uncharacterised protein [Enterobacter hormaechei]